jgi:hypothetical protein
VKLVNEHNSTLIAPSVARSKAEYPEENKVEGVRVSVVLVNVIVPLATETRENPKGVPVAALNKQFFIAREVIDDAIKGETESPRDIPKDNSTHVISNAPVFTIAAPAPSVIPPTESVAFEDVEFDFTVVFVSVSLIDVVLEVIISITFPLSPLKWADPFVAVKHRYWSVPQ